MKKEIEVKKEEKIETKDKKENRKQAIFMFVCGLLVGAIITTGVFLVIRKNERPNFDDLNKSSYCTRQRPDGRNRPSKGSRGTQNEEIKEEQTN